MQRRGERGWSKIKVDQEWDLSGPGVSESYVAAGLTPRKAPPPLKFASSLRENGQQNASADRWGTALDDKLCLDRSVAGGLRIRVGDALI